MPRRIKFYRNSVAINCKWRQTDVLWLLLRFPTATSRVPLLYTWVLHFSTCVLQFFYLFSLVFTCVQLVFTCVHFCSTCVHLCSTCVHLCSTCVHLCSFVFTCVPTCVMFQTRSKRKRQQSFTNWFLFVDRERENAEWYVFVLMTSESELSLKQRSPGRWILGWTWFSLSILTRLVKTYTYTCTWKISTGEGQCKRSICIYF